MKEVNMAAMRELLCEEGYENVLYVCDKPDSDYGIHSHHKQTKYVILDGELKVTTEGVTTLYKMGDTFTIKAEEDHRTESLENGCCYLVGEK